MHEFCKNQLWVLGMETSISIDQLFSHFQNWKLSSLHQGHVTTFLVSNYNNKRREILKIRILLSIFTSCFKNTVQTSESDRDLAPPG